MDNDPPLRDGPINYHLIDNMKIDISFAVTDASDNLRFLSGYQRECVFYDESISYNNCILNCLRNDIQKICGCLPWFLSINRNDQCNVNQYSCLVKNENKLRHSKCNSKCYIYCDHTTYEFGSIKTAQTTNIATVWPTYFFKREVRFGWLDLVVSFGGIMGVFLGYSVLTTVELIYYFSLRFYCGAVLDQANDMTSQAIRVAEKQRKKERLMPKDEWYYDYVN